ncbi:NUDIX domain-containing protein [Glaciihabitans sp. INWT7]|uniref:8-oxo-dGTP diphosphatase n=1 Tax=Glaciihabitans sp. INWT7 TaxID=2596912 RepID=UPI001628F4D9|nr:NUDIX domain-containing protein [Glaciihabitans sp. INWT7]QNE46768.1 NUDIX domain-containing protein [Glaciihabitans sp. INWT7]
MPLPEVCVCYLLRQGAQGEEVLLGRKKFGLGMGNLVGPGGKIEPGETPERAIRREVAEETSIELGQVELVGELTYPFPFKPAWSQQSWVFVCREWRGDARESDELVPEWFPVADISTGRMWDDARFWVHDALAGRFVKATFEFGADLRTVSASDHPAFRISSPRLP